MNVIGVFRKAGTFTDRATNREVNYDNVMLAVSLKPSEIGKNVTPLEGEVVELVKIPVTLYQEEVNRLGGSPLGSEIRLIYGKYGKIQGFDIL